MSNMCGYLWIDKNMVSRYTLLFTFFLANVAFSQDTWIQYYQPWYDDYPGTGNLYIVEDVLVCNDGGYAVNGYYDAFHVEFGTVAHWGFTLKVDSVGNLEWAKEDTAGWIMESQSTAMVQTTDGGIISSIYGYFEGTALIKRDIQGNREWTENLNNFYVHSMSNTQDGNIILSGRQNFQAALRLITEDGETIWENQYSDTNGNLRSVIFTLDSCVAASGTVGDDIFVVLTDYSGDTLWTKSFEGYGDEYDVGRGIAENDSGRICVVGEIRKPSTPNELYIIYGFIWLLNGDGSVVWDTTYPDSEFRHDHWAVVSTPDNAFIASGQMIERYKFDEEYNIIWTRDTPVFNGRGDKSIRNTLDNKLVFCIRDFYHTQIGLVKASEEGIVSIDFSKDDGLWPDECNLNTYPNPFNPVTTLEFGLPAMSRVTLAIYDLLGREVIKLADRELTAGTHRQIWNGTNSQGSPVASGVYICCLTAISTKSRLTYTRSQKVALLR